jgi:tRNA threonylcarbamoyladenosine biosynthesis protein TsaB
MRILAIDTSTKFLCLGLYDDGKIYEYNLDLDRRHSSLIVVTIKRALDALGWKINDIDYFACGLGPGSFTGVRVGLATIKGFAWALNKPILGISTLDILAKNVNLNAACIIPAMDAKRNLIYCSVYQAKDGKLKRLSPYMLLSLERFLHKVKPQSIILGDAIKLYKPRMLKEIKSVTLLDEDYWYPQARNIIILSLEKIRKKSIDSHFKIKPIYLYPKECQIA